LSFWITVEGKRSWFIVKDRSNEYRRLLRSFG